MNARKVLTVDRIIKTYGLNEYTTTALKGISFDVLEGEFLGIMGPSGCGKTTLLNCLSTMTRPSSGKILLKGEDITTFRSSRLAEYRGKEIGYLFQEFELLDNLTMRENIILPLLLHKITAKEAEGSLLALSRLFDIEDILNKFPTQISGGQKQRAAAARSLITEPSIVLADEPTGSLDSKNAKILMDKLLLINQQQTKTIVMVTHDARVASYCSRVLFMQDGRLFHELRKSMTHPSNDDFYDQILSVTAQLGGGSTHVL